MKKRTINITLKIPESIITDLENYYKNNPNCDLISFKIIPETEKLYENDPIFRKLVKLEKDARRQKEIYINDNNF